MHNYWTYKSYLPLAVVSGIVGGSEGEFKIGLLKIIPKNENHVLLLSNNKKLIVRGRVDKVNNVLYAESIKLKI